MNVLSLVTEYVHRILPFFIDNGLRIVLIVVLALLAVRVSRSVARRFFKAVARRRDDGEYQKRADTLSSVVEYVVGIVVLVVAGIVVLGQLGVNIGPIVAAAGVVGLAVGFGAQSLVQDVVSGFFILLGDEIRVGDVVQIAGKGGVVEKVDLRQTTLRDLAGSVHYIRHGKVDVVTNMTKDFSYFVFDIGVAYRENVDDVIAVIRAVDEDLRGDPAFADDITAPIEVLGLDSFGDSAVVIKARTKTKPIKQWGVAREFNRRLKAAFDEKNIEMPFPHVTLYLGEDKQGGAPPLHVAVEDRPGSRSENAGGSSKP